MPDRSDWTARDWAEYAASDYHSVTLTEAALISIALAMTEKPNDPWPKVELKTSV